MSSEYINLRKFSALLENYLDQIIKKIINKMNVNRSFFVGYLKALEEDGYFKSRKLEPIKGYFYNKYERGGYHAE